MNNHAAALDDPLFNDRETAAYLRIHPRTPAQWRQRRRFTDVLPPIYIGSRVFYKKSSLDAFIASRTIKAVAQ
jgi:hypothetical protein